MDHKAIIIVTPHVGKKYSDGHFFLENVKREDCDELKMPYMIEFQKNTESFVETMSVIKDKMKKIQEILNE
jgi:hypothetical protein